MTDTRSGRGSLLVHVTDSGSYHRRFIDMGVPSDTNYVS